MSYVVVVSWLLPLTHMNPVFNAVARTLDRVTSVTGFTYNEINIIAYYNES